MNSPQRLNKPSRQSRRDHNLSIALRYAKADIAVFPAQDDKRPIRGIPWKDAATTDPAQIKRWWVQHPKAIPAIPTGTRNGFTVLGLDVKPEKGINGRAALKALGIDVDSFSQFAVVTPSGGEHHFLAPVDGLANSANQIAPGVDVRSDGGYVIAPGAWTSKGRYEASEDLGTEMMLGLPEWPDSLPKGRSQADTSIQHTQESFDLATIKAALNLIPNDQSYDKWTHVLMALHHATGGSADGLALAQAWCLGYPGYAAAEVRGKWRSFGKVDRANITGATLLAEARKHGWGAVTADSFDDVPDEDSEPQPGHLSFLSPTDCAASNPRPYVIKGLIAQRDVGCVVGAPGVGKSVIAPALAYAVAQGQEAFGRRVRSGRTFYVAAEDEHGMRGRVTALKNEHGDADSFTLVAGVSDLLSEDVKGKRSRDYRALRKAVKEQRPALIVIDTLAMAFPGLEENSAEGMGRVMAVARSLTKWGAAVILVHHDTKDGGGLPRGHSLLNGALDMSLHLTKDKSGVVSGRLTKNRNGGCDESLAFVIRGAQIGVDEDGDQMTAAICEPLEGGADEYADKRLSKAPQAALDLFYELAGESGELPEDEWRDAAMNGRAVSGSEIDNTRRTAFRRAAQTLVRADRLTFLDGVYRLKSHSGVEFDDIDE